MVLFLLILNGCADYEPVLSNKDVVKSKAYIHTNEITNVPYAKAVSNFKKGLNMCAENVKTPSLVEVGTGSVRMPGDTYYHVVKSQGSKLEYNLREFMGGVAVGDCIVCQPEGGFYFIYATLEKVPGNKTKLRTHTFDRYKKEVKAIEMWVKGDLSGCHGFMGKN